MPPRFINSRIKTFEGVWVDAETGLAVDDDSAAEIDRTGQVVADILMLRDRQLVGTDGWGDEGDDGPSDDHVPLRPRPTPSQSGAAIAQPCD